MLTLWQLFTADPSRQMTIVDGDFTEEYFPVLLTVARALQDGELPLWNPYSNGGQPLLADPQAALFYPPTWWALSGISGLNGDSVVALERLIPFHLALAAASSYLLGRVLLGSRLAASVVAIVFTYSGFLTSYPIQQLPILRAAAWFPLILTFFWLALERSLVPWVLLAGATLGLAVLAGHPQTAFLEGVGLTVVTLVWTYQAWVRGQLRSASARAVSSLVATGGIGAGVGAAQLLPTYEFLGVSNRSGVDFSFLAGGFALWELPLDLVAPRVLGGTPVYVGILPLVLVMVALGLRPSRIAGVAAAVAITGLILSTGANTFAYAALYNLVPFFDFFRGQERSIMLFSLGVAILAGSGAAGLAEKMNRGQLGTLGSIRNLTFLALLGALGLWAGLYWRAGSPQVSSDAVARWTELIRWVGILVALLASAAGVLTLRLRVAAARPLIPPLVVALISIDLVAMGWHSHLGDRRPDDVYPPSAIVERALRDLDWGRVYDEWVLPGNHGQAYALPSITRTFPLHLERLSLATGRFPRERLFDLLNVRYVATWQPPSGPLVPLASQTGPQGPRYLYGRAAGPGPAWVVPAARVVGGAEAALAATARTDFDPWSAVVIEGSDRGLPREAGSGRILSYRRGWNDVEVTAEAPQGGHLVVSEVGYPSWRAQLDGQPVPIMRANYLLQAVWLPPGTHRVRLAIDAGAVKWGVGATIFTLAALVGCGAWGVRTRMMTENRARRA
ncbi:MAG: hypothetical protein HY534_06330 [Chloroflexi bacterium]|nr:hypothetical protein [Chloroflexota bacterium]